MIPTVYCRNVCGLRKGGIIRRTKSFLSSFVYLSANQEKGDGSSMDKDDRKIKYFYFNILDLQHNFLYRILQYSSVPVLAKVLHNSFLYVKKNA
jgi:hypothetical protein